MVASAFYPETGHNKYRFSADNAFESVAFNC
jgi:hypothetical protein